MLIVDFAASGTVTEGFRPDDNRIVSGDPVQSARNHYTDATGRFSAGEWSCAVGAWRVRYTEEEFCHLLEGRVALTGDDGDRREFAAGDRFVIPAGFNGIWETIETARKIYVIYEGG